jgi:hypothetical protein
VPVKKAEPLSLEELLAKKKVMDRTVQYVPVTGYHVGEGESGGERGLRGKIFHEQFCKF